MFQTREINHQNKVAEISQNGNNVSHV